MQSNLTKVKDQMRKDGFDQNSINHFLTSGDQRSLEFYNTNQWAKMSEGQASKYTDMLYQGI
ncbi:MAG: hypothetical protein EB038_07115 [Cyclobacteriaceae bacterium]|nr:hypothetical protein [Cyclobacteriaceae bacterium]